MKELMQRKKRMLDQLVAEGKITAQQAEERLNNIPEPGQEGFGRRAGGCGCGGDLSQAARSGCCGCKGGTSCQIPPSAVS